jgi:hypothetical protein
MISDVTENNTINNSKENFKENNKDEISIFFENVAESLMSLPSFSTNSDTDTQISSAELREIQEFVEFCHEKSNTFDKSNSEEIFK